MIKYVIIGITATALSVLVGNIEWQSSDDYVASRFQKVEERTSVTFIMGDDKVGKHFYGPAARHFATSKEERTELVMRTCRTMECIIEFLNHSPGRHGQPWGVINIVAHGNPNTGLRIDITDGGHRATPKRLLQAALMSDLPKLSKEVVDSSTKINVLSCGVGTSPLVNISLKQLFHTGLSNSPNLFCSPGFVIFHHDPLSGTTSRMQASYWPYYYKRGYRPSDWEIAQYFAITYPNESVNWKHAVDNRGLGNGSKVFHDEYHISVSLLRLYETKEDRPDFLNDDSKSQWALEQPELKDQINDSGIPSDKFHWTVHKIKHQTEEGDWVPAVKAVGMATVLFVLKGDDSQPLSQGR